MQTIVCRIFQMRRQDVTPHLIVTLVVIICAMILVLARPSTEPIGTTLMASVVSWWFGRFSGSRTRPDE